MNVTTVIAHTIKTNAFINSVLFEVFPILQDLFMEKCQFKAVLTLFLTLLYLRY